MNLKVQKLIYVTGCLIGAICLLIAHSKSELCRIPIEKEMEKYKIHSPEWDSLNNIIKKNGY